MMIRINIAFFFEDIGHENFVQGLVKRLLREKAQGKIEVYGDNLSSRGGSIIRTNFIEFMKSSSEGRAGQYDLVLVVHDANCHTVPKVKNEFISIARRFNYPNEDIVFAIPDPYIERWYLADPKGFAKGIKGKKVPALPGYFHDKSQRHYYKDRLVEALRANLIGSSIGGAEFGFDIAQEIDIKKAGKVDPNFAKFIADFNGCLKRKYPPLR